MESLGLLNSLNITRGTPNMKMPHVDEDLILKSNPHMIRQTAFETHSFLGESGIRVSKLCLGSFVFGELDKTRGDRPGQCNESEAHKIMDRYVELGGNFIDTADYFPWHGKSVGESERMIGRWLAKNKEMRERLVISTKVGWPLDETNVNSNGLNRVHLLCTVEKSLKNLQTNYIDILHINRWDEATHAHNFMMTLGDLVRSGKVRHIGCADLCAWQVQFLMDLAKTYNMERLISLNTEYNLLTRGAELELIPTCKIQHISLLPYSPLKGGYLTNKFTQNMSKAPENTRINAVTMDRTNDAAWAVPFDEMKNNELYWRVMDKCVMIAKKYNKTVAQVALRWLIQKDVCCSVMISCKTLEQLEENMGALTFALSIEDIMELDRASAVPSPSPYHMKHIIYLDRHRKLYTPTTIATGATLQEPLIKGLTKMSSLNVKTKHHNESPTLILQQSTMGLTKAAKTKYNFGKSNLQYNRVDVYRNVNNTKNGLINPAFSTNGEQQLIYDIETSITRPIQMLNVARYKAKQDSLESNSDKCHLSRSLKVLLGFISGFAIMIVTIMGLAFYFMIAQNSNSLSHLACPFGYTHNGTLCDQTFCHNRYKPVEALNDTRVKLNCCSNTTCCGISRNDIFTLKKRRVVGGVSASRGNWPWLVELLPNAKYESQILVNCSGFLISSKHVLTAAHCVTHRNFTSLNEDMIRVRFNFTRKSEYPQHFARVKRIFIHEKFNQTIFEHDIALLELSDTIEMDFLCLYNYGLDDLSLIKNSNKLFTAGWGSLNHIHSNLTYSDNLMHVDLNLYSIEECHYILDSSLRYAFNTSRQVCAGYLKSDKILKDSCYADSGSPLMYRLNGQWFAYGIVSFGSQPDCAQGPAIHTRIAYYHDWIKSKKFL